MRVFGRGADQVRAASCLSSESQYESGINTRAFVAAFRVGGSLVDPPACVLRENVDELAASGVIE